MNRLLVTDPDMYLKMIEKRKRLGQDRYDEVWEGVYIMPSMPALGHLDLVGELTTVYKTVMAGRARVQPGANVSDRKDWKDNFRVPDIVVVLPNSKAVDCDAFWLGGPDFLTEVQSPGDETEAKIPFYGQIQVQELLIIERDSRKLRLLRHDGNELTDVEPTAFQAGKWLLSKVMPLAFRRKVVKGEPRIEIARTDGKDGHWLI